MQITRSYGQRTFYVLFFVTVKIIFRCSQAGCDSLVRPHVVWFGEALEDEVMQKTDEVLRTCDMCLLVSYTRIHNIN